MKTSALRAGALACALLASTCLVAPAAAQQAQRFRQVDANGVDVTHGDFLVQFVEGSIGSGEGELALVRDGTWNLGNNGHGWDRITFQWVRLPGGAYRSTVVTGNRFEQFDPTGSLPSGSTLTGSGGSFQYRTSDGTVIDFADPSGSYTTSSSFCNDYSSVNSCNLLPSTITSPDGKSVGLSWDIWTYCSGMITGAPEDDCHYWARLSSVSNSFGYSIQFSYASGGSGGSDQPPLSWYQRTGATFHNSTVSGNPALASTSYSFPAPGVTQVTDTGGLVWRFSGGGGTISTIRRPGAASDTTTITGSPTAVTSVTRDGVTTNYSRSVVGSTATMTITNALSQQTTIVSNLTTGRPTSVTDPLSRTTSYQYDVSGRLTRVTQPEGNYVQYTYDSRGNVTETRQVAKQGTGLPDIVTTAAYPASCTTVSCNSPNSTTDERGYTTDYTYDSTHGGLLTVTAPAPGGSGDRPQTRYTYTLTNGEYQLTEISACAAGAANPPPAATCVGTRDERRTVIAYDANGNVTSVQNRSGNTSGLGAASATTSATYDGLGNLLTVDDPLAGTVDLTRYRYNSARQIVGIVGPDPDAAGPLLHRAQRTTYANGLPTKQESGTVSSQSDAHWAAFSSLEEVQQEYDVNALPTVRRLVSGSTTYALTQTNYDALGRTDCVAQRMNPSVFGSPLPSACTPGTAGSYGDDRITRTAYDAAGRVSNIQTGYGITGVATTDVATTYTNNDRVATVTDAEGNRTTYEYDGHDRLAKTRFPSPTTDGVSSTTDYEQLTYLTAAGGTRATGFISSRQLRDTNLVYFGYDNLGRLTGINRPGSDPDTTIGYDLLGRLTAANAAGRTQSLEYDALDRVLKQGGSVGGNYQVLNSTYDAAGRRTLLDYGGGLTIGYSYFDTGDMREIRENPSGSNTLLASYAYDNLGRRTSLSRGNNTSTSYSYDPVSRLSQLQYLAGTTPQLTLGFAYNPSSQIASTTRSNDSYAWTNHYAVNRNYTANGLNRYTLTGSITPTYDGRGNLTSAGTTSYAYDSDNHLITAGTASLAYDPFGRLLSVTSGGSTTQFGYDGFNLVAEYNPAANTPGNGGIASALRRFVHGPGVDEPLVWYEGSGILDRRWFHSDERGSVIAISNSSGTVTNVNAYDEYGIPQSANTGRFQYTGQVWLAEVGMYYYRARMYSPTLGRFMQTDPIGYQGGMNLYAYVANNPINYTDPLGLDCNDLGCTDGSHPDIPVIGTRLTSSTQFGFGFSGRIFWDMPLTEGGTGGGEDGTPIPHTDLKICRGPSRILQGNSNLIGRIGGFLTSVTNNSAAIIPRQFGANSANAPASLRSLGPNVSGWTDSQQYFIGLTDVINHRDLSPTALGAQDIIMARDPGRLIIEIVGGRDEQTMINIIIPADQQCPAHTN